MRVPGRRAPIRHLRRALIAACLATLAMRSYPVHGYDYIIEGPWSPENTGNATSLEESTTHYHWFFIPGGSGDDYIQWSGFIEFQTATVSEFAGYNGTSIYNTALGVTKTETPFLGPYYAQTQSWTNGVSEIFSYTQNPTSVALSAGGISDSGDFIAAVVLGDELQFNLQVGQQIYDSNTSGISGGTSGVMLTGPGIPPGGVSIPDLSISHSESTDYSTGVNIHHINLYPGFNVSGNCFSTYSVSGTSQGFSFSNVYIRYQNEVIQHTLPFCWPCFLKQMFGFMTGDIDDPRQGNAGISDGGVNYSDGQLEQGTTGISSGGFGSGFSTGVDFDNSGGSTNDAGVGWTAAEFPTLRKNDSEDAYTVSASGDNAMTFVAQYDGMGGKTYLPALTSEAGGPSSLLTNVHDTLQVSGGQVIFVDSRGGQAAYSDPDVDGISRVSTYTDPAGNVQSFSYSGGALSSVNRSITKGGHTYLESFSYTTVATGVNAGRIQSISLNRLIDGNTTNSLVRTVTYAYYGASESYGNQGDLKTVTITDAGSNVIDKEYYRYYTPSDSDISSGYVHGLKYVFDSKSLSRLTTAEGDPTSTSLSDSSIEAYAAKHLQYDSAQHVTLAKTQGSGCSCSGSSGQGNYSYTMAGNTNSTYSDDFNKWKTETVETLPDGNQTITYSNYAGGIMLQDKRVYSNPSDHTSSYVDFPRYTHFNSTGQADWIAETSAFTPVSGVSWDDTQDDLLNLIPGGGPLSRASSYLSDSAGLIHVYKYGSITDAWGDTSDHDGSVTGLLSAEFVQNGMTGSQVALKAMTYYAHTDSSGTTTYPIARLSSFHGEDGSLQTTTNYQYQWYSGTSAIEIRSTTMPAIRTDEHGPGGVGDTTVEYFDTYGNVTWTRDGGGYLTNAQYDIPSGGLTQSIVDVNVGTLAPPTDLTTFLSNNSFSYQSTGLHLVTSFGVDSLGRTVSATDPRGNSSYTVYDDSNHEVRTYPGWNSTTHTTTGPIQVTREDRSQNYRETLTMSATPGYDGSGLPNGSETISSIESLSRQFMDQSGRVVITDRFFHMPSAGYSGTAGIDFTSTPATISEMGTQNSDYYRSMVTFDTSGRRDRTIDALNTYTKTAYDGLGRMSSTSVGTGSPGSTWPPADASNYVEVSSNLYDNATTSTPVQGDSNLTQVTEYLDASGTSTRVSQMLYDYRDRLVATKKGVTSAGETDGAHRPIVYNILGNQGEILWTCLYDGDGISLSDFATTGVDLWSVLPHSDKLRSITANLYDDQLRTYQSVQFGPDQANGLEYEGSDVDPNDVLYNWLGSQWALFPLTETDTWYDHRGNIMKRAMPGGLVQKTVYDGAGRVSKSYTTDGAGDSSWTDAGSVTDDNVLEQTEYTYNGNGAAILTVSKSRNHDETTTGSLNGPSISPKARTSYATAYYDAADRLRASVTYGTNSGTSVSTPSDDPSATIPTRSDSVLVTSYAYTTAGLVDSVTDPAGLVTKTTYDLEGRTTVVIEDYTDGTPTASSNRTTDYTYNGLDQTLTLEAVMPSGTNSQITEYDYGVTTGGGSAINSNSLLATVKYPNKTTGAASTSASDQNSFTYDALGEMLAKTDQNGSVHTYGYDVLGRAVSDTVSTLGTGVDGSIRRIGITFDTAGRPDTLTSYSDTTGSTVVNQVEREHYNSGSSTWSPGYNGLGQLTDEYQSHSGAVSSSSAEVQYTYSSFRDDGYTPLSGSRLSSVTYPDGRVINYLHVDKGDVSGVSDTISRVTSVASSSTRGTNDANVIVSYDYLGLATPVMKNYPTVGASGHGMRLDRFGGTSGTYANLDNFDRLLTQEWNNYTVSTGNNDANSDLFKISHTYDRDSNRLGATNSTQTATSHAYTYDNLNRLTEDDEGIMGTGNAIKPAGPQESGTNVTQHWNLDALGNASTNNLNGITSRYQDTYNSQNQISTRKVLANWASRGWEDDFNNSATSSDWDKPGSGDTFDINTTTSNALTVTHLSQDTIDGATEPQAQALLLSTGYISVHHAIVWGTIPSGTASGEFGIVFGYKSGADYWLRVFSMNGHAYVYHVVNGTKTTVNDIPWGSFTAGNTYAVETGGDSANGFGWGSISLPDGFPSGRTGLYTNIPGMIFSGYNVLPAARASDIGGRWDSYGPFYESNFNSQGLTTVDNWQVVNLPELIKNLKLQKFQATFEFSRGPLYSGDTAISFVFNYRDVENTDRIWLPHYAGTGTAAPVVQGSYGGAGGVGSSTPANMPSSITSTTHLWYRITNDGSTITVKCLSGSSAPSEASWSAASAVASVSSYSSTGGRIGFEPTDYNQPQINNFTLQSWNSTTSSWTTELSDTFSVDGSGYASDTLTYDNNGNLTYDGNQAYTYDAWNRLKTTAHAYSTSGTVYSGQVFCTIGYDALGRRITKAITGTGMDDCTYNYYLSGNSVVEERNGSDEPIKDHLWGLTYVDEAVQTRINTNPTGTASWTSYYHLQDANFNELGLVNASGTLVERYEYSAYGQRSVFWSPGSNDPGCYMPAMQSLKVITSGSVTQPYGINEIGHQGLMSDEQTGLVYDRARMLSPLLGRFMQVDPMGYVDGMNPVIYCGSNSIGRRDPGGCDPVEQLDAAERWADEQRDEQVRSAHCCKCGPDVTDAIKELESQIKTSWAALSKTDQTKHWHEVNSPISSSFPWLNPAGWGVADLSFKKAKLTQGDCGTGKCQNTVTVNGQCYPAEEVAYIVYGELYRLMKPPSRPDTHWLEIAYDNIETYRYTLGWLEGVKNDVLDGNGDYWGAGANTSGRIAWTNAGYYDDFTKALPTSLSAVKKDPQWCPACTEKYKGVLTWWAGTSTGFPAGSVTPPAPAKGTK